MPEPIKHQPDPNLDLVLERVVDVPVDRVWRAWTVPSQIVKWFTPAPWKTIDCQLDLRPGGLFHTTMQSPEGENFPNVGCVLEVVENQKFVWTSALGPGYRPIALPDDETCASLSFTAVISLEPAGDGATKYTALVIHGDEDSRQRHEEMGFHDGWSTVLDQLVEMVKREG